MDSSVVSSSDWAELPKHLIDMVLEKLVSFSDYARFSVVCVSWYCVAMDNREKFAKKINRQMPMLLFPKKDEEKGELKNLFNITTNKFANVELRIPYSTRYAGFSRGWLIIVGEDFVVTLINPISPGEVIRLPPLRKNEIDYYFQIHKAIISVDPASEPHDYEVAAIYGDQSQLAFIKPGRQDAEWTYIDHMHTVFNDIIYIDGRLHAVDFRGNTFCLDDNLSVPRELAPTPKHYIGTWKTYLAESLGGDLLLVSRRIQYSDAPDNYRNTVDFELFKWNSSRPIWVKINSLGSESLFLGDNMSISILASEIPGCSPNSVYFTHDFDDDNGFGDRGPTDSGVFNLTNSSFAQHFVTDEASLVAMTEQPPIWVVPNFLSVEPGPGKGCRSLK